ncbi:MAG: TolC family protein, partial [Sphingobacteriales bacterium]
MNKIRIFLLPMVLGLLLAASSCKTPQLATALQQPSLPDAFSKSPDTVNTANIKWRDYFKDPYLVQLIDTALKNNQELEITLQEIEIAQNDIRVRKGKLMPTLGIKAGAGVEKVGRYT